MNKVRIEVRTASKTLNEKSTYEYKMVDMQVYGIISCAVSFWTPAVVMAVAYVRIYRVAKQQQEHIYSLTYSMGQCIVNFDQVHRLNQLLLCILITQLRVCSWNSDSLYICGDWKRPDNATPESNISGQFWHHKAHFTAVVRGWCWCRRHWSRRSLLSSSSLLLLLLSSRGCRASYSAVTIRLRLYSARGPLYSTVL